MKRKRYEMPVHIKEVLNREGAMNDYLARPEYQRNDYIGWIERAKNPETKEKRLNQMLSELKIGGVYMKMKHPPSTKGLL